MAMDTPARIAVLGAGPLGLETALYARFLGYDVDLYERGRVCANLRQWGHARLFSPWWMNVSPLGLAALSAQEPGWRPPDDDAFLTGWELVEQYFQPLAHCDLLIDHLQEQTEVVAVGHQRLLKSDMVDADTRADDPFRILLREGSGAERTATADVIIDATGTYGHPNWAGRGGMPCVGEIGARERIEYGLADVLGRDRGHYAGRRVLLIGAGYSAATSVVALAELAATSPGTQVTWITRGESGGESSGPIARVHGDPLDQRDRLARAANALAGAAEGPLTHWPGTLVDAIEWQPAAERFAVRLAGGHPGSIEVERIIANVGYRPDSRLHAELQIHECYASQAPMKLAAALLGQASADCLDQRSQGPETLLNPEPDFYIIGSKSHGRGSKFLLSVGREQIRELFTIIGDRADLNLYASVGKRLP
ncbi:MAG TPA: FAD-dependent oxidoreductase [Pirellulales bacterium]|nr:FAD-dependent oxidoreductase [Pirellulales bacterium]